MSADQIIGATMTAFWIVGGLLLWWSEVSWRRRMRDLERQERGE